jgi:hypothetical protein
MLAQFQSFEFSTKLYHMSLRPNFRAFEIFSFLFCYALLFTSRLKFWNSGLLNSVFANSGIERKIRQFDEHCHWNKIST